MARPCAPIGYLNLRKTDGQGRDVPTVEVHPERAPLITWAFKRYAEGAASVAALLRDLTARGLLSMPSPKRPSRPLGKNALCRVLTNSLCRGTATRARFTLGRTSPSWSQRCSIKCNRC